MNEVVVFYQDKKQEHKMNSNTLSDKPLTECQFQAKDCTNDAVYTVELKGGLTLYYCERHMRLAKANGVVAVVGIWKQS